MTKPDARQTLRAPIPQQSPASGLKAAARPLAASPLPSLKPCSSCRWRAWDGGVWRCHSGPPSVRMPYDNMAAWPVVPAEGGGCRLWEGAA